MLSFSLLPMLLAEHRRLQIATRLRKCFPLAHLSINNTKIASLSALVYTCRSPLISFVVEKVVALDEYFVITLLCIAYLYATSVEMDTTMSCTYDSADSRHKDVAVPYYGMPHNRIVVLASKNLEIT